MNVLDYWPDSWKPASEDIHPGRTASGDEAGLVGGVLAPVAENEQALLSIVDLAVGVGIRQRLDQTFTQHLYGGGRSERDGRDYVARAGSAATAKATRAALNHPHLKREIAGRLAERGGARVKRAGIDWLAAPALNANPAASSASPLSSSGTMSASWRMTS